MKFTLVTGAVLFGLLMACEPNPSATQTTTSNTADTISYDVVFRESVAGEYRQWRTGDDSFACYYTFTDRGRGPELSESFTLDERGFITQQQVTGVNYLKDSVSESFTVSRNEASWVNPGGSQQGNFEGDRLYFRYDGSPAVYEILARQLLDSETRSVGLYPAGEASLVDVFPLELSTGIPADLLMIKGLDVNPSYLWMDESRRMMASIDGNLHVVRTDLADLRKEMQAIQDSLENEYLFAAARELTHALPAVIIKNVNVFTAAGTLLANQDVQVSDGKIAGVYPAGQEAFPPEVPVIDGTNKTLLPGMFDMHTHNDKFRGILHIAGGITAVRDLANDKEVMDLGSQFTNNEIIGPQIVTYCGIIDGPGPYANQRNAINNLEEGLAEIRVYKDLGYQQIKLYSSIKPEWVAPLVDEAKRLGMRVSGHIPAFMTASQAIRAGYDEIQHINMLFLNFLSDTIDTRTPLRFTMVANHAAELDLESKVYLDFVDLLRTEQILVDPTVGIFENMFLAKKGELSPTYAMIADRLPLITQRGFYSGGLPKPGDKAALYAKSYQRMLEVVADLYRRGVDIVPGTDGWPGFLYHRELELYVRAGIPAAEVLQLATIRSAELVGLDETLGSVDVGKTADLILVDGNPLADISDIRKVEWTLKGGNVFYAKELYASLGIEHFE